VRFMRLLVSLRARLFHPHKPKTILVKVLSSTCFADQTRSAFLIISPTERNSLFISQPNLKNEEGATPPHHGKGRFGIALANDELLENEWLP
jgi:hypothetical protein